MSIITIGGGLIPHLPWPVNLIPFVIAPIGQQPGDRSSYLTGWDMAAIGVNSAVFIQLRLPLPFNVLTADNLMINSILCSSVLIPLFNRYASVLAVVNSIRRLIYCAGMPLISTSSFLFNSSAMPAGRNRPICTGSGLAPGPLIPYANLLVARLILPWTRSAATFSFRSLRNSLPLF